MAGMQLRPFFAERFDQVNWPQLSMNPNALELLRENMDKIVWPVLATNPNLDAMTLIEENPGKVDGSSYNFINVGLSARPEAIDFLERYPEKIAWGIIWTNPGIFERVMPVLK